jgi:hypothetical protein
MLQPAPERVKGPNTDRRKKIDIDYLAWRSSSPVTPQHNVCVISPLESNPWPNTLFFVVLR